MTVKKNGVSGSVGNSWNSAHVFKVNFGIDVFSLTTVGSPVYSGVGGSILLLVAAGRARDVYRRVVAKESNAVRGVPGVSLVGAMVVNDDVLAVVVNAEVQSPVDVGAVPVNSSVNGVEVNGVNGAVGDKGVNLGVPAVNGVGTVVQPVVRPMGVLKVDRLTEEKAVSPESVGRGVKRVSVVHGTNGRKGRTESNVSRTTA